jgi:hypothetical protein
MQARDLISSAAYCLPHTVYYAVAVLTYFTRPW